MICISVYALLLCVVDIKTCHEEAQKRERERERMMDSAKGEEDYGIVIVGGGIGGLATALALHRKGLKSVVYERSESLRAEGSAIGVLSNGWRALDQLGVGDELRDKAILLEGGQDIWGNYQQPIPFPVGEARCLKRGDLVNALANALPPETVRFGYKVVAVKMDPESMFPTLQLDDGNYIQAKVLIGCDGSHSVVADFLGLKPKRLFGLCSFRGLTNYPNGHVFDAKFVRIKKDRSDRVMMGRIPVDNKLVYWFVSLPLSWLDRKFPDDPELIKKLNLKIIEGFPSDAVEMIEGCELESLSITHLRYHAPWEMLVGTFCKGSVTVLGDAMHSMGPFLGQGGSAALEDSVVLARNLARKIASLSPEESEKEITHKIGEAFDQYVEERRMRVVRLATQAYLTGTILEHPTTSIKKFIAIFIMLVLFRDRTGHSKYDCGSL